MRVDPHYVTNLVSSLDTVQSNLQQVTSELSSGVRVTSLSQDPVAAGQNATLLNQIQKDDSFTQTSNTVKGQLQVTDSSLGFVVTQLTSALSLATSANNGTMNSSNVSSVSNQLVGIRNELLALANTSYMGQYVFSGAQSSTAPFALSTSTSPATVTYNGDSNVNYLHTPNGQTIQLNIPGDQIFTPSGSNSVFTALNSLIANYASGTVDTTQAIRDTAALNTALNYVSQQRVTVDNSLSQLTAAGDAVTNEKTQLMATQTTLMQADLADLSTKMSLYEAQQTALESVIVALNSPNQDLFSKM